MSINCMNLNPVLIDYFRNYRVIETIIIPKPLEPRGCQDGFMLSHHPLKDSGLELHSTTGMYFPIS